MSALLAASLGWFAAVLAALELRRRSSLLADAAHELRGPVTALSLGLEALRRQPASRRRAEALLAELGRVEAATQDVAAAARGRRADPDPQMVDLRHLATAGSEAWRPAAARRGGRVLMEWRAGRTAVRADPRRLAQAFGNLLANAVEHGGGEIVVRGERSGRTVRVEIRDRGPREPSARTGGHRGRGLAIAKRAVEQAGGRIDSRERPDGGRSVVAELPLESAR